MHLNAGNLKAGKHPGNPNIGKHQEMLQGVSKNSGKNEKILRKKVFSHSLLIYNLLNFKSLFPEILNPCLKFLSRSEIKQFEKIHGNYEKSRKMLYFLHDKGAKELRRFVASLLSEPEHLGHKELSEVILKDLPSHERRLILRIVKKATADFNPTDDVVLNWSQCCDNSSPDDNEFSSISSSSSGRSTPETDCFHDYHSTVKETGFVNVSTNEQKCVKNKMAKPLKPPPLITLQGFLKGKSYDKIDRTLWTFFSNGQYDNLSILTTRLQQCHNIDLQIVGKWFQSLIIMHLDGDYNRCLSEILSPALEVCRSNPTVSNPTILEGRILQRMAQVYLVLGQKELALTFFKRACDSLQFVSRGYDRVNMLCRRAKILSATSPEKRQEIEDIYNEALQNVSDTDSFALASKPSLILSKAAFHLHISFGLKADPLSNVEPEVDDCDIRKAKDTLFALPEEMVLLDMRKCERQLLLAELLRLSGDIHKAIASFKIVIKESESKKLHNLAAISKQRINLLQQELDKITLADELLKDLPECVF